jgi:hypothetical protein
MQDTKLSFEDGDSQEKPQTNNQGEEDFLDQFSPFMIINLHMLFSFSKQQCYYRSKLKY